jgi:hypothetical protein
VTHQRFTPTAFLTAYAILALTVLGLLAYNEFLEIRHNLAQNFEKSEALAACRTGVLSQAFWQTVVGLGETPDRLVSR